MTDPALWRRARDVFLALADQGEPERSAWLARHRDDPELVAAVRALLRQDEGTEDLRDSRRPGRLWGRARSTRRRGRSLRGVELGGCRLRRELGRGGNGVVYLADRRGEDFVQRVAVKVLAEGAGPGAERTLRCERKILAHLDHPGITRLIDGGTSEEGVSFLVMELALGQPIGHHCEEQALALEERCELFLQACAAVEYVHRQRIVHLDLKPANLVVSDEGRLKLLDFGIAKPLPGSRLEAEHRLAERRRGLSPGYASPEQVLGRAVTPASDVYSLGVLLYELLTGIRPARPGSDGQPLGAQWPHPEPPSAVVRRAIGATPRCGLGRRQLTDRLRGELDRILLTALAPSPVRRYGSVESLAADLRRYLLTRTAPGGPRQTRGRLRLSTGVGVGLAVGASLALSTLLLGDRIARSTGRPDREGSK